jgi:alpha-L-fucosidase
MAHPPDIPDGPFKPEWASLQSGYKVPSWYLDDKFGIFIHWGVYCVPAFKNEWYPRNMYIQESDEWKHHLETYGRQTDFGYKDFIPFLTAEKFDADEWADLFKNAGKQEIDTGFPQSAFAFAVGAPVFE